MKQLHYKTYETHTYKEAYVPNKNNLMMQCNKQLNDTIQGTRKEPSQKYEKERNNKQQNRNKQNRK